MGGWQPISGSKHVDSTSPTTPPAKGTKPPAAAAAKPAATDRLHLSPLKTNLKNLWDKANPWVHEKANTRQIDTHIILGSSSFTKQAKLAFAKVDANHDGTLSTKELDAASKTTTFSQKEMAAIKTMRQYVDDIEDLSDDEHFLETKGITRDDLEQVDRLSSNSALGDRISDTFDNQSLTAVSRPSTPSTTAKAAASKRPTAHTLMITPPSMPTKASATPKPATKAGSPAEPPKSLLKRIDLTTFKAGMKALWEKKNPWVHERANVRQIDPNAKASPTTFTTHARGVFDRVDGDRNGTLSTKELTTAMGSSAYRNADAAAIGAMHRYVDEIEDLSNDERFLETKGITKKDLQQFDKLKADSDLSSTVLGNYYNGLLKIGRADRRLYANDKSVSGSVIEQGSLGDCYFLAGVTSLAETKPDAIKKMIRENKDGTYTVSFPGRKPVTVSAPTDAEIARYVSSGKDGIWLNVLEKAYAKSRNDSRLFAKGDMYKAIEGGFGRQAIKALTNKGSDASNMRYLSHSQLLAKVSQGQAEGRLMTISTGHPFGRDRTKANSLPTGHEYTMLGYDADSRKYRIRNPWGSGGAKNDGMLELTADEVKKNFVRLTVQER